MKHTLQASLSMDKMIVSQLLLRAYEIMQNEMTIEKIFARYIYPSLSVLPTLAVISCLDLITMLRIANIDLQVHTSAIHKGLPISTVFLMLRIRSYTCAVIRDKTLVPVSFPQKK